VKSRSTRLSRTGGSGALPLRPRFLPNALHQPICKRHFQAVRSAIARRLRGQRQEEAAAGLGFVAMGVDQRVRPICRGQLGVGDRIGESVVVAMP
jgi:hypothetical protein